ncbi:MAG: hypothetical protein JO247_04515 [Chloroflexi bacterium]|nr:hypothetical protein [Chloroflexota bacterium]
MSSAIDLFLTGVEAGAIPADIFTPDAELDATVPNWRYTVRGGNAVRSELNKWYADPGQFTELMRTPIPHGELIQFRLTWTEEGVPHACHQAHVVQVNDGRIASDTAWCGGRWPAELIAQMAAAEVQ